MSVEHFLRGVLTQLLDDHVVSGFAPNLHATKLILMSDL